MASFQEINPAKLAMLFRREFLLCGVKPGETIALLSDLQSRAEYVAAAFAAAEELGADIYDMKVNAVPSWTKVGVETVGACKGTLEALAAADLLVCLHVPLFTKWLKRVRDAGTRVLLVIDAPDDLEQLMAPPGLKEACLHAGQRLEQAKAMRITNDAGTDLTVALGGYPTMVQYGFAELPGRFDHWGGGHVHTFPNEGSAHGTVVIQPGDIVILPYCRYVQDAIRLDIRDGHIRAIEGGLDAKLMSQWLEDNKRSPDDLDGASTRRRAGTPSRCTAPSPSGRAPRRARSPATSCSRPGPTPRAAARAIPRAITTCRCATAPCCSTTSS